MNKKQIVRLTESDLHRIVKESVNRILKETYETEWFHSGDKDLSRDFEDAHERLHKKYRGKLSPQEIERMAEYEVHGAPKPGMPQGRR